MLGQGLVAGAWCLVPGASCLVLGLVGLASCLVLGPGLVAGGLGAWPRGWWLVLVARAGAWCLVPGAWCLVPGLVPRGWCLVPGGWWLVPGACCLVACGLVLWLVAAGRCLVAWKLLPLARRSERSADTILYLLYLHTRAKTNNKPSKSGKETRPRDKVS